MNIKELLDKHPFNEWTNIRLTLATRYYHNQLGIYLNKEDWYFTFERYEEDEDYGDHQEYGSFTDYFGQSLNLHMGMENIILWEPKFFEGVEEQWLYKNEKGDFVTSKKFYPRGTIPDDLKNAICPILASARKDGKHLEYATKKRPRPRDPDIDRDAAVLIDLAEQAATETYALPAEPTDSPAITYTIPTLQGRPR